jgi:cystathionine beta-lyase
VAHKLVETVCAHEGEDRLASFSAAAPPLVQTSTFVYPDAATFEELHGAPDNPRWDYTRVANPTTAILEAKLATLEHGTWARAFASGMGAITATLQACLRAGDHAVCTASCYGPTRAFLDETLARFGVATTYVDGCDPASFIAAMTGRTRVLYLESPTSLTFEMPEIRPVAAEARRRGIVSVFDNSWASPVFCQPLDLGCDLVLHSATKFIGGHSDVVAGVVVGREDALRRRVLREAELAGACLDPFAAWLLLRGLRTLKLRMAQHQASGLAVAQALAVHPNVASVHHPGLETDPGHAVANRQLSGFSGLFILELADPSRRAAHAFVDSLRLFSIGVSWGGHESLALALPAGRGVQPERYLVRLHCGLEATEDLVADVLQALG